MPRKRNNKTERDEDSGGIDVIPADGEQGPHCAHGECEKVCEPAAVAEISPTTEVRLSARLSAVL